MRRGVALVGLLLAASATAACSPRHSPGSGQTGQAGQPTTSAVSTPTVSPDGVSSPATTPPAQAQRLALGKATTVDWSPHSGLRGRIRLQVTAIERADWSYFHGWQVRASTRRSARPYFIHATVASLGGGDLGGQQVPLYALDAANQLVQASTFGTASGAPFAPCHPDTLSKPFRSGDRIRACLVMLVPRTSRVLGATFRPHESDQPITWEGRVKELPPMRDQAS